MKERDFCKDAIHPIHYIYHDKYLVNLNIHLLSFNVNPFILTDK